MGSTEPGAVTIGYWLSSEEHPPGALVDNAVRAEEAGFDAAMISDHFHPWVPRQGNSPFVWAVLGAIARVTTTLRVGTGVSAPVHRIHPVVLAQAAATVEVMMPGRFFLGLGTGERLNEQWAAQRWPRAGERREMLEEAVDVIRRLFAGKNVIQEGPHWRVEQAQLYTRPDRPPPIMIAVSGWRSAEMAGRLGDGMIGVAAEPKHVEAFEAAGGGGKPRIGQVHVCWAEDEAGARRTAREWWPQGALPAPLLSELSQPSQFEAAARMVTEDDVARSVVCGPDPERHVDAVARFVAAGFTEVYVHQVGPDQEGFLRFYRDAVLPRFR
ncbi:MAG TPA: TIGR03557 family F420-dependent LLM class oxidoreductase [Acidimicrobiales bacterium]|jgi:G6PDH family F420-dependent oxidoreductase